MSVFDKLLDSIKLNDDDYDEDNYLDEDLMDDEEGDFFDDDPWMTSLRRNSSRNSVVRKRMIWLTQILPLTKNLYIQQHPKTAAKGSCENSQAEKQRPV